jgi:ribonuclease VapC
MIVDTSAIMAILQKEPEAPAFGAALTEGARIAISAATLVELCVVAESRAGAAVWAEVEALMADAAIEVAPFTAEQAALAREGWRRFGKGRHPAGLNLGDCFAFALAQERGEPLLFKGGDFALTDVRRAL